MKICRYTTSEEVYGYMDDKDGSIHIRSDMHGADYLETFIHEFIHWLIWKILHKRFHKFFHCWFDMFDGFINTFDFRIVKNYYKEYYR